MKTNFRGLLLGGKSIIALCLCSVPAIGQSVPPAPVLFGLQRQGETVQFRVISYGSYASTVEFADSVRSTNWLALTNFGHKVYTFEAVVTDYVTNAAVRFCSAVLQSSSRALPVSVAAHPAHCVQLGE